MLSASLFREPQFYEGQRLKWMMPTGDAGRSINTDGMFEDILFGTSSSRAKKDKQHARSSGHMFRAYPVSRDSTWMSKEMSPSDISFVIEETLRNPDYYRAPSGSNDRRGLVKKVDDLYFQLQWFELDGELKPHSLYIVAGQSAIKVREDGTLERLSTNIDTFLERFQYFKAPT